MVGGGEISNGPVFRAVGRGGRVSCQPLADDSAARIVKRCVRRVGLDPSSYAGHSLRSGFLTSAAESGASLWKLSEVSVQGARGGRVPLTGNMHAIDTDNARWCITVARVGKLRRLYDLRQQARL